LKNIDNEEGDEGSFENDDLPSLFRHNISFFFEIDGINAFIRFFENKYSDIPMEGVIAMFNSLFQVCC
jgi:hypothetical protein